MAKYIRSNDPRNIAAIKLLKLQNLCQRILGGRLAKDRRCKKKKARKKACSVSNLEHSASTDNLNRRLQRL